MVKLASREYCTGCGACKETCPKGAIVFEPDAEGFPSPVIREDQCVNCGACEKVCPALHAPEMHPIRVAYAAQIKDESALMKSSSGGVFTALAREIFKRGGLVYGCVWDQDYNVVFRKAENEEEMLPMRGSKYVWSWAGDTYPEIRDYLEAGRTVLFTGCPCQVAGLRNYLKKDYANLYLADFLCSGSPSPLAFREYIKSITKKIPMDQLDFRFRDKEKYGVGAHISYNTPIRRLQQSFIGNPYYFSFYSKVIDRRCCYHCSYRYEQRVEDITFCDYWGVQKYHSDLNTRAGVSAVFINTDKGTELINTVREELLLVETKVQDIAAGNNLTLGEQRKEFKVPSFREKFFSVLQKKGWSTAERRYLNNKTRLKLWIMQKMPVKCRKALKKLIRGR